LNSQLYATRLKQRIIEVDAKEFATDEEVEKFFLAYGEPQLDYAVTVGCAERNDTKQQNRHHRG
jgi:hypothetical protein